MQIKLENIEKLKNKILETEKELKSIITQNERINKLENQNDALFYSWFKIENLSIPHMSSRLFI